MGPIHPVWALAAIHPRWGNRSDIHPGARLLQGPLGSPGLGSEGSSVGGGGGGGGGGGVWKFGVQKMKKIKILEIQIRSAQNVGKVWISRKKILPAPFGAI